MKKTITSTNCGLRETREVDVIVKNELEEYFLNNEKRYISKWWHYFEIYDRYFSQFKDKEIKILEIGIYGGGSLQMWKNYFGKNAKIYGIDIRPECKKFEEEGIEIRIGSQADPVFINNLMKEIGEVDLIIDDGSHINQHQIASFNMLYPHLKENGFYLCEDVHTSYWPDYGGGLRQPYTFIEETKNAIDKLNYAHAKINEDYITNNTYSIHYYDSIVIFEKRKMLPPWSASTGNVDVV